MPTPIGHSLAGYAAAKLTRVEITRDERRLFAFAACVGVFPDLLGFVLEWLVREPNHGFSHSLAAVAVVSVVVALAASRRGFRFWPILLVVAAAYASHLVTDLLRPEPTPDAGEQLLWPLHTAYALRIDIFPHAPGRGEAGGTLLRWAWATLPIMLREFVILAPLAAAARFIPPLRSGGRSAAGKATSKDPATAA